MIRDLIVVGYTTKLSDNAAAFYTTGEADRAVKAIKKKRSAQSFIDENEALAFDPYTGAIDELVSIVCRLGNSTPTITHYNAFVSTHSSPLEAFAASVDYLADPGESAPLFVGFNPAAFLRIAAAEAAMADQAVVSLWPTSANNFDVLSYAHNADISKVVPAVNIKLPEEQFEFAPGDDAVMDAYVAAELICKFNPTTAHRDPLQAAILELEKILFSEVNS